MVFAPKPASVITTPNSDDTPVRAKTTKMSDSNQDKLLATRSVIKTEDIRTFIEEKMVESLVGVLQIQSQEFDIDTSYTDFGVDSILAVEILMTNSPSN